MTRAPRQLRQPPTPTLITPDSAGEWSRVTTDAAQDNAEAYLIRAEEEAEPGLTPLFAEYVRDEGSTLAYLGLDVDPPVRTPSGWQPPQVVVDIALADAGSGTDRPWTPETWSAGWRAASCPRSTASKD